MNKTALARKILKLNYCQTIILKIFSKFKNQIQKLKNNYKLFINILFNLLPNLNEEKII